MREVDSMRTRLTAAEGLTSTLVVSLAAFGLIRDASRRCQDRSDELYAAYAMAATSAALGRKIIAAAPSMPTGQVAGLSCASANTADLDEIADALGMLASELASRLSAAARQASGAGDEQACERAAREAARVCEFLARDP
jgi:hypothetical protein